MKNDSSVSRFFSRLARVAPSIHASLRPGASDAGLWQLEMTLGRKLPEDVKALLRLADGQQPDAVPAIYGLELLSAAAIAAEWKQWRAVRDEGNLEELDEPQEVLKRGTIQARYTVAGWIPLFRFPGRSDYLGVDLEPGPKGRVGQLINFGRDQEEKYVAAPDLESWFALLDTWAETEGEGDVALAQPNLERLFSGGLAMARASALARKIKVVLEPPAPIPQIRPTAGSLAVPGIVEQEAGALLAILDEAVRALGPRRAAAGVNATAKRGRDEHVLTYRLDLPCGAKTRADIQHTLSALFAVADQRGLPLELAITFAKVGADWERNIAALCGAR